MQTFLPLPDFRESARVLDRQRLGKQRSEVKQLLRGRLGLDNLKTRNHPASLMWDGYLRALLEYGYQICSEWQCQGYADTVMDALEELEELVPKELILPPWFGENRLHSNHRARLLEKNYEYYSFFGWTEQPTLTNYWPGWSPPALTSP